MKNLFLFYFLIVLSIFTFADNLVKEGEVKTLNDTAFVVYSESNGSVSVKLENFYIYLTGYDHERFLNCIKGHIDILTSLEKEIGPVTFNYSKEIASFTFVNVKRLSTKLQVRDTKESYSINMFFSGDNKSTFVSMNLTQLNELYKVVEGATSRVVGYRQQISKINALIKGVSFKF